MANKLGFMGSNEVEAALIDMITEHVRDIKQKYSDIKAGKKGEELDAAKLEFTANELPKWMSKLEICIGKTGYAVGSKISLADITIYTFVTEYFDDKAGALASTTSCPGVTAILQNVATIAKSYLESRPVTFI